jgi:hypothetical protein
VRENANQERADIGHEIEIDVIEQCNVMDFGLSRQGHAIRQRRSLLDYSDGSGG